VAAEVVDHHYVAGLQGGDQDLLDVGQEALAGDWSIQDAGRLDPVDPQGGQEGERAPASMRHFGDEPFPPRRPPMTAGHVGLGPGLIDEDQARRINAALVLSPLAASPGHVRPILLTGAQAFF
jgi:hypothetical protein